MNNIETVFKKQDQYIDEISKDVLELKKMSLHISNEIDESTILIDNLSNNIDNSNNRLNIINNKVRHISIKEKSCFCLIILLIIVIIILIIIYFIH